MSATDVKYFEEVHKSFWGDETESMQGFSSGLNAQSGAFLGAAFLPIMTILCRKILIAIFQFAVPSSVAMLVYYESNLLPLLFAEMIAGAVLGSLTSSVLRLVSQGETAAARRICLWRCSFLLILVVTLLWFPLLRSVQQQNDKEFYFLYVSIFLGAPTVWILALIFCGLNLRDVKK